MHRPGPAGALPGAAPTLLAALCALLPPGGSSSAPQPERPSFVLCMADDQGWGDAGYAGHPVLQTPTLDALAASGLRLDRFYAASPICSPTRGSVLTGRHPNRFGCFTWGSTIQPSEITLAEVLRAAGYATGHFGKWHLGALHPESPYGPAASGFETWVSSPNVFGNDPWLSAGGRVEHRTGEGSRVVVDAALDFVRAASEQGRPFLAVLWFSSPHSPYLALPEDLERYRDQPEELASYLGELTALDRAVGHLRGELRALGLAEHTLLWYTSDNGPEALGSTGGLSGDKGSLAEGGIRVPCLIEWPAVITAPRASAAPCGTVDIYPTLLELAGVALPPDQGVLDGRSLAGLIRGDGAGRRDPLGFWVVPAEGVPVVSRELLRAEAEGRAGPPPLAPPPTLAPGDRAGLAAWIDGDHKLRGRCDADGACSYLLFDLARDPGETRDLTAEQPERAARMRAALEDWQRSVVRSLNGEDR